MDDEHEDRTNWTTEMRVQRLENDFERFRHRQAKGAFIHFNSFKMTRSQRVEYAKELLKGTGMKVVSE